MKTFARNLIPEIHLHINPINRDIFLIAMFGLLVAISLLTMVIIALSHF